ncbi:acyl carrier protein [Corynebacterium sp. zg-331]|uniref:phosphopantetheine-binding protein n=1 Tax=unclassified Corynebacterium TaxID=2624378 RepID=UPI00128C1C3F|nr:MULTISPECIES: phosphopantetheine-binding protein [unclassified Corynebacterium]MBC3186602.1 acyl carrier protein [Corynebacterium sp. zg-331]MPV53086.1 acyl carrier protein [Corynebacterium sp. zg331]
MATTDEILREITAKVADMLDLAPEQIDAEEELFDQGLDSVRLMDLVTEIRRRGFDVDFADLAEDTRLSSWRAVLNELAN